MLALLLAALPILVVPTDAIRQSPDAQRCFAQLLELSGHGRRNDERAAFLTWEGSGRVGCVVWPATNQHRRASYRGKWPENTAAIAHTHPRSQPEPSVQDRAEARRIGIPIFVVTPERIAIAE
ncbi:MAG TPA: Mov34/MPN/PAD-1 family protein [Thermoanaerobaculia bacterium]|jgi:hypothetical protein